MKNLIWVGGLILISCIGCANQEDEAYLKESGPGSLVAGSGVSPGAGIAQDRKAQLEANLRYQLRQQLQGQHVELTRLEPSNFPGLDFGDFAIGEQSFSFLTSNDDSQFFVLATEPFDASLSLQDIEDAVAAEDQAASLRDDQRAAMIDNFIEGLPSRGNPDADIVLVEFSDFQCPFCLRGSEIVEEILANHPNEIKFVFAQFPLDFHPWAFPSAVASVCAADQSEEAFWSLHDHYFGNQDDFTPENVIEQSAAFLTATGIDLDLWRNCAQNQDSDAFQSATAAVQASIEMGRSVGVGGTPGFFINGAFINGAQPMEAFESAIEDAKQAAE